MLHFDVSFSEVDLSSQGPVLVRRIRIAILRMLAKIVSPKRLLLPFQLLAHQKTKKKNLIKTLWSGDGSALLSESCSKMLLVMWKIFCSARMRLTPDPVVPREIHTRHRLRPRQLKGPECLPPALLTDCRLVMQERRFPGQLTLQNSCRAVMTDLLHWNLRRLLALNTRIK